MFNCDLIHVYIKKKYVIFIYHIYIYMYLPVYNKLYTSRNIYTYKYIFYMHVYLCVFIYT